MRIVLFYHSLISEWNSGNAHFLIGIVSELSLRGHSVTILEPSFSGSKPLETLDLAIPKTRSYQFPLDSLDLDHELLQADLVMVQEGNPELLVSQIGEHRSQNSHYRLLFHDSHHRILLDPNSILDLDLKHYDGVLTSGKITTDLYCAAGIIERAWTWHEAADTRIFHPVPCEEKHGDLVWIGNWTKEETTQGFSEFLIQPIQEIGLHGEVYGIGYPQEIRKKFQEIGIQYRGWIPSYRIPEVYSRFHLTLNIPRRTDVHSLPGIPALRIFEALACGIPLISTPWNDTEKLFTPGLDFLIARNGIEMKRLIRALLNEPELAKEIGNQGRETILKRHTCANRVDELISIFELLSTSRENLKWASA